MDFPISPKDITHLNCSQIIAIREEIIIRILNPSILHFDWYTYENAYTTSATISGGNKVCVIEFTIMGQ